MDRINAKKRRGPDRGALRLQRQGHLLKGPLDQRPSVSAFLLLMVETLHDRIYMFSYTILPEFLWFWYLKSCMF